MAPIAPRLGLLLGALVVAGASFAQEKVGEKPATPVPVQAAASPAFAKTATGRYWNVVKNAVGQHWNKLLLANQNSGIKPGSVTVRFVVDSAGHSSVVDCKFGEGGTAQFAALGMLAVTETALPPPPAEILDANSGKTPEFMFSFTFY